MHDDDGGDSNLKIHVFSIMLIMRQRNARKGFGQQQHIYIYSITYSTSLHPRRHV